MHTVLVPTRAGFFFFFPLRKSLGGRANVWGLRAKDFSLHLAAPSRSRRAAQLKGANLPAWCENSGVVKAGFHVGWGVKEPENQV